MDYLEKYGINIVSLVLVIAFIYPILTGIIFRVRSKSMMDTFKSILTSIALVCSILLTSVIVRDLVIEDKYKFMKYISQHVSSTFTYLITKSRFFIVIIYILAFIIVYQLFKLLVEVINGLIFHPISDAVDRNLRKAGRGTRAILGGIFHLPKALCYMIILTALLTYASIFLNNNKLNSVLGESSIYTYINKKVIKPVIESEVAKKFPAILEDSFKVVDEDNNTVETTDGYMRGVLFYNGVTLDEGVRSNQNIDSTALSITGGHGGTYNKGKVIYEWVGKNISYDDNKAVEVMKSELPTNISSGAISAYNTKSGVCFDYACLYVAMCRANNIGVRLIVGEGYNGVSWVSHSWNEIYIPEEERWVPVDCTFYTAGNYYNNDNFNAEHRGGKIAGEWN